MEPTAEEKDTLSKIFGDELPDKAPEGDPPEDKGDEDAEEPEDPTETETEDDDDDSSEDTEEAEDEPEEKPERKVSRGVEGRIGSLTRKNANLERRLAAEREERNRIAARLAEVEGKIAAAEDPEPPIPETGASTEELATWIKERDAWKERQAKRTSIPAEVDAQAVQAQVYLDQREKAREKYDGSDGGPSWDELADMYGGAFQASTDQRFVAARRKIQDAANPSLTFYRLAKAMYDADMDGEADERNRAQTRSGGSKGSTPREKSTLSDTDRAQAKKIFGGAVSMKALEKARKRRLKAEQGQ